MHSHCSCVAVCTFSGTTVSGECDLLFDDVFTSSLVWSGITAGTLLMVFLAIQLAICYFCLRQCRKARKLEEMSKPKFQGNGRIVEEPRERGVVSGATPKSSKGSGSEEARNVYIVMEHEEVEPSTSVRSQSSTGMEEIPQASTVMGGAPESSSTSKQCSMTTTNSLGVASCPDKQREVVFKHASVSVNANELPKSSAPELSKERRDSMEQSKNTLKSVASSEAPKVRRAAPEAPKNASSHAALKNASSLGAASSSQPVKEVTLTPGLLMVLSKEKNVDPSPVTVSAGHSAVSPKESRPRPEGREDSVSGGTLPKRVAPDIPRDRAKTSLSTQESTPDGTNLSKIDQQQDSSRKSEITASKAQPQVLSGNVSRADRRASGTLPDPPPLRKGSSSDPLEASLLVKNTHAARRPLPQLPLAEARHTTPGGSVETLPQTQTASLPGLAQAPTSSQHPAPSQSPTYLELVSGRVEPEGDTAANLYEALHSYDDDDDGSYLNADEMNAPAAGQSLYMKLQGKIEESSYTNPSVLTAALAASREDIEVMANEAYVPAPLGSGLSLNTYPKPGK